MCECGNKGTIMVYDRELEYVRQIACRGMKTFHGLSTDSHGNLFVTDHDNVSIKVFSIDGNHLCSFSNDENGVKKLSGPCGACVAGWHIHVADKDLHNVSVFTTEGVYVISFGHCGSKKGSFDYPCGLGVDRDGFGYIADYCNHRVQVF